MIDALLFTNRNQYRLPCGKTVGLGLEVLSLNIVSTDILLEREEDLMLK